MPNRFLVIQLADIGGGVVYSDFRGAALGTRTDQADEIKPILCLMPRAETLIRQIFRQEGRIAILQADASRTASAALPSRSAFTTAR